MPVGIGRYRAPSRRAALHLFAAAAVGLVAPRRRAWADDAIDARAFGAAADGSRDDAAALRRAYAACLSAGRPLYLPSGHYRLETPLVWDPAGRARDGITVYGDGAHATVLDFVRPSATPQLWLRAAAGRACFYSRMHDFAVQAVGAAPVLQVGGADFADAHNAISLERVVVNAAGAGPAVVLNAVYNGRIDVVANAAGAQNGTALRLRQAQFCAFTGAQGNAAIGTWLGDGYNFGNVFTAIDYEALGTAVCIAGPHCVHNTWIGGTIAHAEWGFDAGAGSNNRVLNINPGIPFAHLIRHAAGLRLDPAPDQNARGTVLRP